MQYPQHHLPLQQRTRSKVSETQAMCFTAQETSISISELIYTQLANTDNNEDSSQNDSSARIILKKKRAIVSKSNTGCNSSENITLPENFIPEEPLQLIGLLIEHRIKEITKGTPFLSSGLSPPSV